MATSDYHVPFHDEKALSIVKAYAKDYKPDYFIINGDFADFYSISRFDKNPERKLVLQDEMFECRKVLYDLKKSLPKKTKIIYLEGNHENRLQLFLWKNPELYGMSDLTVQKQLHLDKLGIKYVTADNDYWKTTSGHFKIGDMVFMHGDNRLNGASLSKYAGYSAKNTMMSLNTSITMGHGHRGAVVSHETPYQRIVGVESGCLCQKSGTADWHHGFATMEVHKGKAQNHQFRRIHDGKLYTEKYIYG